MLHVSLWKLQVRFASDVEKKTLLNLLITNYSNQRTVLHCSSRQLYQTKTQQQNNGDNFGRWEAPKSRVRGPGENPSWGQTRSSGTGGSHPGQES